MDVAEAFMLMAERALKRRDELARALEHLLRFIDDASEYELQHAADYSVYLNARAALSATRSTGDQS